MLGLKDYGFRERVEFLICYISSISLFYFDVGSNEIKLFLGFFVGYLLINIISLRRQVSELSKKCDSSNLCDS